MKSPVYLLDGYSLIYRSYFAFIRKPLRNPRGGNSSAVFGFFKTLLALFAERRPQYFAVILDSTVPTFRHELYPAYKATREKTPEDLHAQVPVIEGMLKAFGVPVLRMDRMEADDIIASLAERCREQRRPCYIISGDKDLLQLVGGSVMILRPEQGVLREVGPAEVLADWHVRPEQMLDYLSLVGDASDNVPGAKGIGDKTAVALLERFGSLDDLYADLSRVESRSQREKLEASRDTVDLSRALIRLRRDLDLELAVDDLEVRELNADGLARLLESEGMHSLADELSRGRGAPSRPQASRAIEDTALLFTADELDEKTDRAARPDIGSSEAWKRFQRGEYVLVNDEDALDRWIGTALRAEAVSFDTETTDVNALDAELVGFSLCCEEGRACYVPVRGPGGLGLQAVLPRLRRLIAEPGAAIVGQNLKFDYKIMKRLGLHMRRPIFDTMVAAWLLDADYGAYGMDRLAETHLGLSTIHFSDIVPKGMGFQDVEPDVACAYAAEDADVTYRLYRLFSTQLEARGLAPLFRDIEMPLVTILGDMELTGIRVLPEVLLEFGREIESDLRSLELQIFRLCGREFNINSTQQLQDMLFRVRGLKPVKKTQGGSYSTDVSVLEELSREDPVPEMILRHRTLSKLKSTYVDALPVLVHPRTGRIHTSFQQTGTATGRISSRDPNLQNIPVRDERRIRNAFVAAPGCLFLSADYAQIELVVLAHLSGDPGLRSAFIEGRDVHRATAARIFEVDENDVTADQRRTAKTINFGIMYGMSSFRLSRELNIPRADAERFIAQYFETYAGIKGFMDRIVAQAEAEGRVTTLFGRQRPVPAITSRNRTEKAGAERVAVNTPIQGTAADIVKMAMISLVARIGERGLSSRLVLQVHDELIFEVPMAELTEMQALVREEMERAARLDVPLKVSVESGESWGCLH